MFKRLRERIAEEATKFPVGQLNNNSGKQLSDSEGKIVNENSTEDLITLSDSSAVVVPQNSPRQFSIGDEDGSTSEHNTPQKKQNDAACISTSEQPSYNAGQRNTPHGTGSDLGYAAEYRPTRSSYVPQSDIESEREDPPTLNLESISKDQLLTIIDLLKARVYKYKNKYSEVVKNYKEIRDEKLKIENMLIDNQDKGLRRMAELREQCQLEQKAKAHLEANLRLLMEEKDSRISVLETQINLLKEGGKTDNMKTFQDGDAQNSDTSSSDLSSDNSTSVQDHSSLKQKIERLEHQSSQAKKTITSQTEQISMLRKQNENLSLELEEKVKKLNEIQDEFKNLESNHESTLKSMQVRLEELEKKEEESVMSMAETKRNMHVELEIKEKQLRKAEGEAKEFQNNYESEKLKVAELQKKTEERVHKLQHQLESTEKMLEEEKQNLMQELTRGKTAAITLMQQECDKKLLRIEEEWKIKLQNAQVELEKIKLSQTENSEKKVIALEEKLKASEKQLEELQSIKQQLEKDNGILKSSLEKLESANLETRSDESLKCLKDKLENAEKNHLTQMDEMKSRLSLLEKEKLALKTEKAELLRGQEKLTDLKNIESAIKAELKSKEEELRKLQLKHETTTKDQAAKIHSFQETMKDKENMILKLKANIETLNKDSLETNDELRKKIKALEVEREQLMMQAQERVSITEAKYREDIKSLQERNNKLLQENDEIEKLKLKIEQLVKENRENCSLLEAAKEEILLLKEKLSKSEVRLSEAQNLKQNSEAELLGKLQMLQDENSSLLGKTNHVESLKAEKEELNEKLKEAEHQVTSIKALENERDRLQEENSALLKQLDILKSSQGEDSSLKEKYETLKESENTLRVELDNFKSCKEDLEAKLSESNSLFETEIQALKLENEKLSKQIGMLEKFHSSDPESTSVKEYIAIVRGECEAAIRAKEEEMETKLKHLVRDFCIQMDVKDKDCDKMMAEMIEKSQDVEDRLLREHRKEASELRQSLFEKECALDEMRDHYEETLQKKEKRIKELQLSIKKIADGDPAFSDVLPISEEGSDWDDTWAVPDEGVDASPIDGTESCKDHLQQIESLQEEVNKCNSEIKELKILLRLSPPESMVNNNNQRDSLQSIPEPTEFEYLKNIIYEYMMGKEPITLVKVIAAVLRFSDSQTQQVIRREEARHPAR